MKNHSLIINRAEAFCLGRKIIVLEIVRIEGCLVCLLEIHSNLAGEVLIPLGSSFTWKKSFHKVGKFFSSCLDIQKA